MIFKKSGLNREEENLLGSKQDIGESIATFKKVITGLDPRCEWVTSEPRYESLHLPSQWAI